MEFTHQGASWTGQRDKVGVPNKRWIEPIRDALIPPKP
jgi:hypothetical protein